MKYQEQKYQVDSLDKVRVKLKSLGLKPGQTVVSNHYYASRKGNDVIKLVEYENKTEIHRLEELHGKFILKEKIPMENIEAGLGWLKDQGYDKAEVIKMVNVDYEYKNGIVGLYFINDSLNSVILDFPPEDCDLIEQTLGLDSAKKIEIPFNKLLAKMGKRKTISLLSKIV